MVHTYVTVGGAAPAAPPDADRNGRTAQPWL